MQNTRKHLMVKILSFILAFVLLSSDLSVGQFGYTSVAFATEARTGEENSTSEEDSSITGMAESPAGTMVAEGQEDTSAPGNLPIETEKPQESEQPAQTEGPQETEQPVQTEGPQETEQPAQTEKPKETEKPQETKKPDKKTPRLKAVSGVRLVRYSTGSVKVTWKKHKKAKYYRVYYYKKNF